MNLTKEQWLRIVIALSGICALVAGQLLQGHFDLMAVIKDANFSNLLEVAGVSTLASQIIKRLGDTSPKHLEAKVEAKVAEKLRSSMPPGQGVQ